MELEIGSKERGGGFLTNQETQNTTKRDIETLKVNDSWKKRFRIIDKYYDSSKNFIFQSVMNDEYKNLSRKEAIKLNIGIRFNHGGIGTFLAGVFFGPFYYLVKGMWLKAIVYTLFLIILINILAFLMHIPENDHSFGSGLSVIFGLFAPFDYYRLKVLGKQW